MTRRCGTSPSAWITARRSGSCAAAARAFSVSASSFGSGAPLTSTAPRRGTITDRTTWTSSPCAAWGRSNGTAGVTMILAVTMKITSRTSMTSTRGVTLMPEMIPSACWPLGAATELLESGRAPRPGSTVGDVGEDEVRQDLRAGQERDHPSLQIIVGRDGGERDQDADGRRDQRLGDARHD